MSKLTDELEQKEKEWTGYAEEALAFLKNAPPGKVKSHLCHGKYNQFMITDRDDRPAGRYAGSEKKELIRQLVQKDYYQKILNYVNPALRKVQAFLKWYSPDAVDHVFEGLPASRRALVRPVRPTDEEFLRLWSEKQPANGNPYPLPEGLLTNQGENVRSKSEKIIADTLFHFGVPYLYEVPLNLRGLGIVFPDFTVLNVKTRQTFYFEHFGRMGDPEYAAKTQRKISAYEKNGLWFGDGLLFTFESDTCPLDTVLLEKMIRRYLL